jgi:hypothetical protein
MRDHVKDMRPQQNDKLTHAIIELAQDAILMMDPEPAADAAGINAFIKKTILINKLAAVVRDVLADGRV